MTSVARVWNPEACGQLEEELQTVYTQALPHTSTCQNRSIINRKIKTGRSGHSCSAFVMMRTCNSSELLVPKPQTLHLPVSKGTFWLTQTKLRLRWPLNVKGIRSKFTDFTHERKRCGFICSLISPVEGTVGGKATLVDLVGRHGVDLSEKQQEGAWTPDDGGCPNKSPMSYHWLASWLDLLSAWHKLDQLGRETASTGVTMGVPVWRFVIPHGCGWAQPVWAVQI